MNTGIIYEFRNIINGMYYVGQTIRPKARYNAHIKAYEDSLFHRAIRKYGFENFEYSVVATYEHETEQGLYDLLNEAEKERIKFRNSIYPNGYNVSEGGKNGNPIAGFTQEEIEIHRTNCSVGQKNNWDNNPERHVNLSINNPMKRQEVAEKISGDNHHMKRPEWREWSSKLFTKEQRSQRMKKHYKEHPETSKKQAITISELTWIHNDELKQDKRKKGEELIELLNNGWIVGRKYSFSKKFIEYSNSGNKFVNQKGMKPVNNGIICKKIHESKVDEFLANNPGWVRGYIKKSNKITQRKGRRHFNNGKIGIFVFPEDAPEGFVPGPLYTKKNKKPAA